MFMLVSTLCFLLATGEIDCETVKHPPAALAYCMRSVQQGITYTDGFVKHNGALVMSYSVSCQPAGEDT